MSNVGIYKTKEQQRFRAGNSSFELPSGATVKVTQEDISTGKVLVEFDKRTVDWFSVSVLNSLDKVND